MTAILVALAVLLIGFAGSVTSWPRPARRTVPAPRTLKVTLPYLATSIDGRQIAAWDSGLMPAIHLNTKGNP